MASRPRALLSALLPLLLGIGCGNAGVSLPALRLRGGRGGAAAPAAAAPFEESLVELLDYLRASSCTNGSTTAACTCAGHAGTDEDSVPACVEGELEEEEPNLDSLDEAAAADEHGGGAGEDEEDEDDLLARPARTQDEWEQQLDIMYERQLDEERQTVSHTCQCAYCVGLRQRRPARGAGDAGDEGDANADSSEGDSEDDGDERHLTRDERRARDKQMYRHIVFARNLPHNMTTDEMLELFGKYGSVVCISAGSRREVPVLCCRPPLSLRPLRRLRSRTCANLFTQGEAGADRHASKDACVHTRAQTYAYAIAHTPSSHAPHG